MPKSNILRLALIPQAIVEQNSALRHVRNTLIASGIAPHLFAASSSAPTATVRVRIASSRVAPTHRQFSVHANDKWRVERLVQQVRDAIGPLHADVVKHEFVLSDANTGRAVRTNEELDRAIADSRSAADGTWLRYTVDKSVKAKPRAAPPTLADSLKDYAARTRPLKAIASTVAATSNNNEQHFQRLMDDLSKGMGEAAARTSFGKDATATRAVVSDLMQRNTPTLNAMQVRYAQHIASALTTDLVNLAADVHARVDAARTGAERQRAFEAHVRRSDVWPQLKQMLDAQKTPLASSFAIPDQQPARASSAATTVTATATAAAAAKEKNASNAQRITNINDIHMVIQDKLPDWTNSGGSKSAMEGRDHVKERGYEPLEEIGHHRGRERRRHHHHHHGPVGKWLHEQVYGSEPAAGAKANGAAYDYYHPHGVLGTTVGVTQGALAGATGITQGALAGATGLTQGVVHGVIGNGVAENTDSIDCDTCSSHGGGGQKKSKRRSIDNQIGSAIRDTKFVPFNPISAPPPQRVGRGRSPFSGSSSSGSSRSASPIGAHRSRSASSGGGSSSYSSRSSSRSVSPITRMSERIGRSRSSSRSHSNSPMGKRIGACRSHSTSPSGKRIGAHMRGHSSRSPSPAGARISSAFAAAGGGQSKTVGVDNDLLPIRDIVRDALARYDSPPLDTKPASRAALTQSVGAHMKMSEVSLTFVNRIMYHGRRADPVVVEIEGKRPRKVSYGHTKTVRVVGGARKIRVTYKGKVLVPEREYAFHPSTMYTIIMTSMNINGALVPLEAPHLTTVNSAIRAVHDRQLQLTLVDSTNGKQYRLSNAYTEVPASVDSVLITRDDGAREYKKIAVQRGAQYTIGAGIEEGNATWMTPVLDRVGGNVTTTTATAASAVENGGGVKKGFNFLE